MALNRLQEFLDNLVKDLEFKWSHFPLMLGRAKSKFNITNRWTLIQGKILLNANNFHCAPELVITFFLDCDSLKNVTMHMKNMFRYVDSIWVWDGLDWGATEGIFCWTFGRVLILNGRKIHRKKVPPENPTLSITRLHNIQIKSTKHNKQ